MTGTTRPHPHLEDPRRDLTVDPALTLTKVNPAFMTRQIAEIAATERGVHCRITGLNPLRPENRATEQERRALERFEQGAREGDVRGGISVTLPLVQAIPLLPLGLAHLVIGLVGIAGIVSSGLKLDGYCTTPPQQQSIIDALTGILHRRSFSETILREIRRARRENLPPSIVTRDIDRFKDDNDRYGHEAGDECLRRVAQAIDRALHRPGDFCARDGGEEFVVTLSLGVAALGAEAAIEPG